MFVWLFMLAGVIGCWFMIPESVGKKNKNRIFLIVAFVIVVFCSGSRCPYLSGSADLFTYFNCYRNAIDYSLSSLLEMYRFENGYLIFNDILAWLFPWDYFIIYFESAFCFGVMIWYICKNSKDVFMSVIIYICVGPWSFFLTGFRQGFAISLCLIAFELLKKRHLIYDLLAIGVILLATSFHTTAWVFFLVFLIRRMRITRKVIIYAAILTIIALFFAKDVLALFNVVSESNYVGNYVGNIFGGIVPITVYTLALVLSYYIYREDKEAVGSMMFELSMLLVGLCIYITRYRVGVFERISLYFVPVVAVLLPNILAKLSNKVARNILWILCLFFCVVLYLYRMVLPGEEYHFYWTYLEELITI